MSIVNEPLTIRKAKRMMLCVAELSEDVNESADVPPCDHAQVLLHECAALASHWRASLEYFARRIESDELDFRAAGEILRPACEETRRIYEHALAIVQQASASGCSVSSEHLEMAQQEINNIAVWSD